MKRYWLSFDLGLKGNYDTLFQWLDSMKARECGDFMATFETTKTRDEIKAELSKVLDMDNARIYLIEHKWGGQFIIGKRKVSQWIGYAKGAEESGVEK